MEEREVLPTFVPVMRRDRPPTALAKASGVVEQRPPALEERKICVLRLTSSSGAQASVKPAFGPFQLRASGSSSWVSAKPHEVLLTSQTGLGRPEKKRIRSVSVIGNSWQFLALRDRGLVCRLEPPSMLSASKNTPYTNFEENFVMARRRFLRTFS